jgi:heme-degrading monooxygenase HmoA
MRDAGWVWHGRYRQNLKPTGEIGMMRETRGGYVIVWEFRPRPGVETRFEEAYGHEGVWAKLFQRAEGFLGTALLRDEKDRRRFLTIDSWVSKQAYEAFRAAYRSAYQSLDGECEGLTESENEIGKFERL